MKNIRDPFVATPESFHFAVENTLSKLEDDQMKGKVKWPALMIAAVLVMITATGFAAAGFVKGIVDWNGNLTPVHESLNPLPTPEPVPVVRWDYTEKMHDMIEDVPAFEYWEAITDTHSSGKYGQYAPVYNDMNAFLSAIDGFGDMVVALPEGGTFQHAEVFYDVSALVKEMYAEETTDDITFRKYHVNPPTAVDREGYWLRILNKNNGVISAYVFDYPSYEEAVKATGTFFLGEEDKYSVLEIAGFKKALMFEKADLTTCIEMIHESENGRTFSVSLVGGQGVSKEDMLEVIRVKSE